MSAGAIVAIIVAIAVVVLVIGAMSVVRRRKLQQRFGPEYDRVVGETHSHRKAGAELTERERRVRSLDIHPLEETAGVKYAREWAAIQVQFVDQPEQAVAQAGLLVTSVMKDRGYPTEDYEQILADLSVEHANTLDHYRAAHQVSLQAEAGRASTEDLRLAMLHYRALFGDLLGQPAAPAASVPADPAGSVPAGQAGSLPDSAGGLPDPAGGLPDSAGGLPDPAGGLPDPAGGLPDPAGSLPDATADSQSAVPAPRTGPAS